MSRQRRLRPEGARAGRACAALLLGASLSLAAEQPSTSAPDPALEARVKALTSELRCLVCQNQTVAESDAPVAQDMRREVRVLLAQGKTEEEIKRHMQERFGDFVLYRPPFKASTVLLWVGPFVLLAVGVWWMLRRLRAQALRSALAASTPAAAKTAAPAEPEPAAARARARQLLEGGEP
ncbi:MAG: cytochrome c-type biogenesis protein CcmH [Casimicrobiaceae bacterium]|nr:cytochrome c-type biogenesis protein CcmH [Casimicrobiaceae bacterium]MCX8098776.1 cytochrome c-type biogenesis protein CcmH [Casimicrobiaceae bacterium]MDW8312939.1 cytochrome c-type biogenesis protein [Burkholderiales bacterium]